MAFSETTQFLIDSIVEWTHRFPPGIVAVTHPPIPADDDYGLETIIRFTPSNPDSCPMEIGVTLPQAGSATYISLDTLSHIGELAHAAVLSDKAHMVGLYVEPVKLSIGRVVEICEAVAAGAVFLNAGILLERLFCVAGYLRLPSGHFSMNSPSPCLLLSQVAAFFGCGKVIRVNYAPWISSSSLIGNSAKAHAVDEE